VQALTAMQAEGLLKGGSEGCSIVAYGDRWYNPDSVRFFDDEPVRHKLLDILVRTGAVKLPKHLQTLRRHQWLTGLHITQGDISLLATGGNWGLPRGHIVAYQATHALHVEFIRALSSQLTPQ